MDRLLLKNDSRITLLFLSWRDIRSSKKGGAEVFTHEMLKRLDRLKYRIIHISPLEADLKEYEEIDGVTYIRNGNILSSTLFSKNYYKKNRNYIDYVVDQCNTFRYFTFLWIKKSKRIFFIHQLTKDIWFKNAKFPLNLFGFLFEPVHLWLTRDDFTITVSDSTKSDLLKLGFKNEKITILPEGINFLAWKKEDFLEKEKNPTFIYVGRFVHYKGIDDSIIAFGKLKEKYPNSKLWVVGKKNDKYIKESLIPIMNRYNLSYGNSFDDKDITFWGFVSDDEKYNLMSRSHALIFPSTREGWGLTVTESAVVGTPSIVYNSPGLVDAVNHGEAGYLCNINTPKTIYSNMLKILENREAYETMRSLAYSFSKQFHWDNTSQSFENFLTFIKK